MNLRRNSVQSDVLELNSEDVTIHVPTIVVISMMKKINEIIDVINK